MKDKFNLRYFALGKSDRILKIMKITAFLLFMCVFSLYAEGTYSQQTLPPLDMKNVTLGHAFSVIEKESGYVFLFTDDAKAELKNKVNIRTGDNSLVSKIVEMLLKNTTLNYLISNHQIVVYKKNGDKDFSKDILKEDKEKSQGPIRVSGTVTDDRGEPLAGVTVILKSNKQVATATDGNGKYLFTVPAANDRLIFSFIGMDPQEVVIKEGVSVYNVKMAYAESQLKEVVVETGMFQRDKVSFTGATSSFSGTELKSIGNQNVIQSLKTLDPSFVVLDNINMGSNPNVMPTIELRGQGSATLNAVKDEFSADPNQPLFVLNGVEANLTRIMDLDINRIESITILKDAGSTAIYGSKGANGVVVIETVKPKPGELKISYTGDFQLSFPDLSVYNMMNSREKLEFERLSGKYMAKNGLHSEDYASWQIELDRLYNARLADINRGVDTYWLSEPVRTGFTQGHSVRVSGGNNELSIDVGGKYKNNEGVMKESKRQTWAGDIGITYRSKKFIVSNFLDVTGYYDDAGRYGSFSTWVNTSPYFKKRNEEGGIDKYLQYKNGLGSTSGGFYSSITNNIPNPLYNAMLNSKDYVNNLNVSNSLLLQYMLNDAIRFKAGIDLLRAHNKSVTFTAPENTKYEAQSIYLKGEYSNQDSRTQSYKGYLAGTYGKTFNKLHTVTANVRGELGEDKNDYISLKAVGFPYGSSGSPNLAHAYVEDSKPGYSIKTTRNVSLVGALNYNFDRRYLFDVSYSLNGASTFGSNKLFQPFWSAGIGWNIDREAFAKDWKWLDMLKLRGSLGTAGNQNIGTVYSKSVYNYYINSNIFGQGIYLNALGNPDIPWQVSKDMDAGIDFKVLSGRLSLTFDVYKKKTDPLIANVPQVPSTGVSSYPMQLGNLENKGFEFVASFSPVYDLKNRIIWTIKAMGANNKSTYGGLGNRMDAFNESQRKSNTMQQYMDGQSPNDIWAVRSYGIDPSTGSEVFIKKDGTLTFTYDPNDAVVVGSTRPDLSGVINTSLRYKNFYMNLSLRYSLGSDIYNDALYSKVENITLSALEQNQDKRALYDRWQKPGDVTQFRAIQIVTAISAKTSRFVQKNDYLNAEAISFSYDLVNNPWLKKNLGVETLTMTAYMNDIFRMETSKTERGIDYPFARTISLSLNLLF